MRRSTRPLFTRGLLATGGGVALLASLLVPASQAAVPGETAPPPAAVTAAETTPAVSPMAQTGPRNIIKRLSDTYIKSTDTADHSQEHLLHVGTPDNGVTKYRSFMRFDVAKLRGAPIKSASLRVYNSFVSDCAAKAGMSVEPVSQAWDQSTITWANQPAVVAGRTHEFGLGHPTCPDVPNKTNPAASNGIYRIDVTDWVTGWADGTLPNHGVRFSAQETGSSGYKDFCSMNPVSTDYACHAAYNAPTLEVEFNERHTPIVTGNSYGPTYPNNYPTAHAALEFFDSTKPSVWPGSGPYQRWIPDAYHSVLDTTLKGDTWAGGTSHKLRPGGVYGEGDVLVTGDGASGFVGVIPYPSLAGYHWAINVGAGDLHGVELLDDGNVLVAFASRKLNGSTTVSGGLALYSKAQGTPGSWNATPAQQVSLGEAHEVVYDAAAKAVWAIGGKELVRYPYVAGRLDTANAQAFPLPKQWVKNTDGTYRDAEAWGHDLSPVYGNPDRLWVGTNGGIIQFSKSAAAPCYTDKARWPLGKYVTGTAVSRWCNDFTNEPTINSRPMIKSIGNDPRTGTAASICAQSCSEQPDVNNYTSPYIRFITTATENAESLGSASSADRHYRATWAVPAYQ